MRVPKEVREWFDAVEVDAMFLSVATVFEIEVGVRRLERRDPGQGVILRRWKSERLARTFSGRVLPIDETVADCCAGLQVPDPRPLVDALIAATAIVHKLSPAMSPIPAPCRSQSSIPGRRLTGKGNEGAFAASSRRATRARQFFGLQTSRALL